MPARPRRHGEGDRGQEADSGADGGPAPFIVERARWRNIGVDDLTATDGIGVPRLISDNPESGAVTSRKPKKAKVSWESADYCWRHKKRARCGLVSHIGDPQVHQREQPCLEQGEA